MVRKPLIHIVSRSGFPKEMEDEKGLYGYQTGDHIYALKGKKANEVVAHETYHFEHNHPHHPKNPRIYIRNEIDADLYAMEQTGKRQNIKPELKAVANDVSKDYKMPISKVIRIMCSELKKKHIPKKWKKDFNHIVKREGYPAGNLQQG